MLATGWSMEHGKQGKIPGFLHILRLEVMVFDSATFAPNRNSFWQKVINGCKVSHWACINFSRSVPEATARGFCQELSQMCQISGMVLYLSFLLIFMHKAVPV